MRDLRPSAAITHLDIRPEMGYNELLTRLNLIISTHNKHIMFPKIDPLATDSWKQYKAIWRITLSA